MITMRRSKRRESGRISVHTSEIIDELCADERNHAMDIRTGLRRASSAPAGDRMPDRIREDGGCKHHRPTSISSFKSQSDHTFRIQNWLNEKSVRNIQERTDFESRATKNMYTTLLENEDTFVKELDGFLHHKAILDRRKKMTLFKKWEGQVYSPVKEKINQEMDGPNYNNLDRRKRELYRKYLDYSNKKGVVFLDVMSPEEYNPLVLNANRPAPLKAITHQLDDPLISQGVTRLDEDRTVIKCETGQTLSDKTIEDMHLPPAPLVPLGRHGTECETWLRMQLHDIDSGVRRRSGLRMKGIYNNSQVDFEKCRKTERDPHLIDTELRSQKRRLFDEKHATTVEFNWPELPQIPHTSTYHPRIPNVLPLGSSFEYPPELQMEATY